MSSPVSSSVSISSDSPETPLSRNLYLRNLVVATLLIGLFYLFCLFALGVGALVWSVVALVGVLGSQYGGSVILGIVVAPLGRVIMAFARSLKIGRGKEFRIALAREEAPRLWAEVDELARTMGVASPREIFLENGVSAWVELRGFAAGRGRTRLGVGLDLLVGLTPPQGRAVLAHEIAHAKHVKRGYQGFLMRGVWRLNRCRATLEAIASYEKNAKGIRTLAKYANFVPLWLGERAEKLIAACSRFDEFEADREAALLCGSEAARSALLATYVLSERSQRLSYRERLLRLGRGDVAWLEAQLQVRDDQHRHSIEEEALIYARRDDSSTHPALPDRLAALDVLPTAQTPFIVDESSSTFWLAQAGNSAKRLLEEVEKLAAAQERAETRELARRMKKRARDEQNATGGNLNRQPRPREGALALILGMVLVISTVSLWNVVEVPDLGFFGFLGAMSLGFVGWGVWIFWPRPRALQLEVFPYGAYRNNLEKRATQRLELAARINSGIGSTEEQKRRAQVQEELRNEEERVSLSAVLRSTMDSEMQSPEGRMRFWNERGFSMISQADFERAALCARLSLEAQRSTNPEAWLVHGLVLAFGGQTGAKESIEAALQHDLGWSGQWARAFWHFMAGSWESGEALFLELCRQRPNDATLAALLGACQAGSVKAREALSTRRHALDLYLRSTQDSPVEEAWYRFDLARSLVALGQTDAAREQLLWIENHREEGFCPVGAWNFELEWLNVAIADGDAAIVDERLSRLIDLRSDAAALLRLSGTLMEDSAPNSQQQSQALYEHLLEIGYYPQALMALAQMSVERGENALARQQILASLDCTRERPFEAVHPLSVLNEALRGLRFLGPAKLVKVEGYEAVLDASALDIGPDEITLLCFFENDGEAVHAATQVFSALVPEQDLKGLITIGGAPSDVVPGEPVKPGIVNFKFE